MYRKREANTNEVNYQKKNSTIPINNITKTGKIISDAKAYISPINIQYIPV